MRRRLRSIAWAAWFAAVSVPYLDAATIVCPNPSGGIVTFQDALDAAAEGDVVLLLEGEYRGTFSVAGKADLTIRGVHRDKVVLDARPDAEATGPALHATACPRLRVEDLTLRNAAGSGPDGVGLRISDSAEVSLARVRVEGCESYGVLSEFSPVITLVDCEASGNAGGVSLDGNTPTLLRVTVEGDALQGIQLFGDDATVERCTVRRIRGGSGIDISGQGPRVFKCEVSSVLDDGTSGIATSGAYPDLRANAVEGCDTGIFVIYGAEGVVRNNQVRDCFAAGIRLGGVSHHLTLEKNRVTRCGSPAVPGYWLDGDAQTLIDNTAERCGGDGFRIVASAHTLVGNRALGNVRDGFDVDAAATGTRLEANVAKGNAAEGIENSGADTALRDNVAKKNRLDFASDGTVVDEGGNGFVIEGAPAPQID